MCYRGHVGGAWSKSQRLFILYLNKFTHLLYVYQEKTSDISETVRPVQNLCFKSCLIGAPFT